MPGVKQACPMVAACWSPAMPEIADRRRRTARARCRRNSRTSPHLRQHRARHAQELQQLVVPVAGADVEQQRARRVGGVGGVHLAAGQPPQQKAVDRAEQRARRARPRARAGDVVEHPGDLGGGEIRIEQQAGLGRDRRLVALGLQLRADVGGAAVLPDDGAVDRPAGGAVPDDRGLALVGDADGGDVLGRCTPACCHRLAAGRDRRRSRSPPDRARPSRAPENAAAIPAAPMAAIEMSRANTMARVEVVP